MLALCARAGEPATRDLRELAAGVAFYAVDLPATPGRLPRLTAHALGSLGRPDSARRVLLFGTGLLRSDAWLVAGSNQAWTLDLHRLLAHPADRLELSLFLGLDLVIGALAPLWDRRAGRGLLALRHASEAARRLLGPHAGPRRTAALRHETRRVCENRLEALAATRGWDARPHVLFADPPTP